MRARPDTVKLVAIPGLVLLAALLPAAATAQGPFDLTGTTIVSLKGTLTGSRETAKETGYEGISLGFTGQQADKVRWFGVAYASLFGGNTFDAKSMIYRGAHYTPTVRIVGPPELVNQLRELPDGTRVAIEGALEARSRNLLVDMVKPLPK
jgi:hypothetical protein